MKFLLEIDIPEAIKGEVVPETLENMFQELARHYKSEREKGTKLQYANVGIRDGNPELRAYFTSIITKGEITNDK